MIRSANCCRCHLSANDYYEKGRKIEGHWIGQACERYGVVQGALVEDEKFELLKASLGEGTNRDGKMDGATPT